MAPDILLNMLLGEHISCDQDASAHSIDSSKTGTQFIDQGAKQRQWQYPDNNDGHPGLAKNPRLMNCHIRGFGACMINGFPHSEQDSFFYHALERLRKETTHQITTSIFTLGGFPVTRAHKHLQSKCLNPGPDIVVLQFATTDLVVPVRRKRNRNGRISPVHHAKSARQAAWFDQLIWQIQGFVGAALSLSSITQPKIYLETLSFLARTLLEHDVIPVVMSPFVFGGQRSDRVAREWAGRLKQAMAEFPKAVYVDAYAPLDQHPRNRMLLADGVHLSLEGHKVVADALWPRLKESLLFRSHPMPGMLVTHKKQKTPALLTAPGICKMIKAMNG